MAHNQEAPYLPITGFARLPVVLAHVPVSRSAWWAGIQDGRFPAPVKLGPRTTAWRAEDIHALIDQLGRPAQER
jgi:prophage regulatory protein